MNLSAEIREARARATALREAASACSSAQGPLKVRLIAAAESLESLALLSVRSLDRVETLQAELAGAIAGRDEAIRQLGIGREFEAASMEAAKPATDADHAELSADRKPTNALMIAGGSTLDIEDFELILRALDVFDRFTQNELANEQDAALIDTRSRLLIVRAKLREQGAS